MSIDTFKARWPNNIPGPFYVSDQCADCKRCADLAPGIFSNSTAGRHSYVARQPASEEETRLARQALEECPVNAIQADGERFNWALILPRAAPGQ